MFSRLRRCLADEQFHNEDKSPYGPITMLYSMWHASTELEGYGQQGVYLSQAIRPREIDNQMRIPSSSLRWTRSTRTQRDNSRAVIALPVRS
jgi:hypothetical protein